MSHHDHSHTTPVADAEAVARAHAMWTAFNKATIVGGGAVAIVLIMLLVFVA